MIESHVSHRHGAAIQIDSHATGDGFDFLRVVCNGCGAELQPGTTCTDAGCPTASAKLPAITTDMIDDLNEIAATGGDLDHFGDWFRDLTQTVGGTIAGPTGVAVTPSMAAHLAALAAKTPIKHPAGAGVAAVAAPTPAKVLTPEELAAIEAQRKMYMQQMGLDDDEPVMKAKTELGTDDELFGAMVTEEQDKAPPPTKHAVKCDEYSLYKGRDLNTDKTIGVDKLGLEDEVISDCFAAVYEDEPTLTKNCTDPHRQDFINSLLDCSETQTVRSMTVGDPIAAEIATVSIAGRLKKYLVENKPDPKKCPPSKKGGAGNGAGPRDLKAQVDTMVAAAGAARSAKQAVEDYEEAKGMVNPDGGRMDPKRASEMFSRIRKSKRLTSIANLAGRYRRVAASKQRNKTVHGPDDVVGVTVGGDPFNMIPSELANLAHPQLRYETLSKLAENRALVWDKKGVEPVAKGPIVVVVDESGSMTDGSRNADGTVTAKVEQAKALALAMAWIAAKQKRFCALVGFSGGTQGTLEVLPPGQWDEKKVLDWLEHFFGGGTDMDVPMKELPETYWPKIMKAGAIRGKTDIVIVTDGIVNMPPAIEKKFMDWKKEESVKLYTILLMDGHEQDPGDLKRVSDTVHKVARDQLNENCEAVANVLSV